MNRGTCDRKREIFVHYHVSRLNLDFRIICDHNIKDVNTQLYISNSERGKKLSIIVHHDFFIHGLYKL